MSDTSKIVVVVLSAAGLLAIAGVACLVVLFSLVDRGANAALGNLDQLDQNLQNFQKQLDPCSRHKDVLKYYSCIGKGRG